MIANAAIRKRDAAQAAFDMMDGRPIAYGKHDCLKMIVRHLRKLGHRVTMAGTGRYSSALGARRSLKRAGHDSLAAAVDAHGLARIPPAAMVAGDIAALPGDSGFEALGIALGNGRLLAFHPDGGGADVMAARALQPLVYVTAWRVDAR